MKHRLLYGKDLANDLCFLDKVRCQRSSQFNFSIKAQYLLERLKCWTVDRYSKKSNVEYNVTNIQLCPAITAGRKANNTSSTQAYLPFERVTGARSCAAVGKPQNTNRVTRTAVSAPFTNRPVLSENIRGKPTAASMTNATRYSNRLNCSLNVFSSGVSATLLSTPYQQRYLGVQRPQHMSRTAP